jgi:glycosyltransferase involved in cell wall biosynthesis
VADPAPLVSVVVPTRDSLATIETCLRSIRAQTYRPLELIVVDNQSTNGTWEMIERLADVAIHGGPERSAQRNIGVKSASGEFVLWIDSDMELRADVVEAAVRIASSRNASGVVIPEVTVGDGFWARCRALERRCYLGEALIESPRFVRREYLERTGGFAEWLSGTEDAELRMRMLRQRIPLARAETLILHHEGGLSLTMVARKRFYYGLGLPLYRKAHRGALPSQGKATARALVRRRTLLAPHPLLTVGVILMRLVEAAAYLAGASVGALRLRRPHGQRGIS